MMVQPINAGSEPADELDPGTSRVLTAEGWEVVAYVDPEDDWGLQEDGSWLAPDGLTRSWPLDDPEPPRQDT